jgi:hypothetical protein
MWNFSVLLAFVPAENPDFFIASLQQIDRHGLAE